MHEINKVISVQNVTSIYGIKIRKNEKVQNFKQKIKMTIDDVKYWYNDWQIQMAIDVQ